MTLEQLRIFLAVAEHQHITRAAARLGLTQAAVSASVSALEKHHKLRLFDRIGRGIALNEEGRLFLHEARAILGRVEMAELLLADLSTVPRGRLRIHASQTVANYWLPERLMRMREALPEVEAKLVVGNTQQVAAAVQEGIADLGLVEGEVNHGNLRRKVVARDQLVLVMATSHDAAGAEDVAVTSYVRHSWILREEGSGTRSEFEAVLRSHGLDFGRLRIAMEMPSNEAVLMAVASGTCVSVLSQRAVVAAVAAGWIKTFPVEGGERPFSLLLHPDRHRTRGILAALEFIK
jgi:DNA-binding transcriptional LysR family regulator